MEKLIPPTNQMVFQSCQYLYHANYDESESYYRPKKQIAAWDTENALEILEKISCRM